MTPLTEAKERARVFAETYGARPEDTEACDAMHADAMALVGIVLHELKDEPKINAVTFTLDKQATEVEESGARVGAIGVARANGDQYDFIFGEEDCAEQLAAFLGLDIERP